MKEVYQNANSLHGYIPMEAFVFIGAIIPRFHTIQTFL